MPVTDAVATALTKVVAAAGKHRTLRGHSRTLTQTGGLDLEVGVG